MVKRKKKKSFNKVWESILQADAAVGLFLFKDPSTKKTRKEQLLALTLPTHATLYTILFFSTLIITKFELINVIICLSLLIPVVGLYTAVAKFIRNEDTLKELFAWCESLYDVEKKIHTMVQRLAESHLLSMENRALKMMNWMKTSFYVDAVGVSVGFALLGLFLPESIYPKYSPPIPLYLPFKKQETWIAWITTVLAQTILLVHTASLCIYVIGIFFCIAIHIFGVLDIIQEFVGKIKQEMLLNMKDIDNGKPTTSKKSTIQLEFLAAINQNSAVKDEIPFNEWMQILTDMISDVNSVISLLGKLYSELFLLLELACLGTLFVCGLVFTVVKQQYFFAIGIMCSNVVLFLFCFINEKILDKLDDVKEMLYDIPWYELDVKQRKVLLIVMNCDKIQRGFTAAGIHSLTIERFGIIMKAGYTNMVALKDLVQK